MSKTDNADVEVPAMSSVSIIILRVQIIFVR
jgi:hypothetical protein